MMHDDDELATLDEAWGEADEPQTDASAGRDLGPCPGDHGRTPAELRRRFTPTDRLRQAAAQMRALAEAATAGPWTVGGMGEMVTALTDNVADTWDDRDNGTSPNAAYIAAMHPAVALAVADLLDLVATRHTPHDKSRIAPEIVCDHDQVWWPCDHVTKALALADAFLGSL